MSLSSTINAKETPHDREDLNQSAPRLQRSCDDINQYLQEEYHLIAKEAPQAQIEVPKGIDIIVAYIDNVKTGDHVFTIVQHQLKKGPLAGELGYFTDGLDLLKGSEKGEVIKSYGKDSQHDDDYFKTTLLGMIGDDIARECGKANWIKETLRQKIKIENQLK